MQLNLLRAYLTDNFSFDPEIGYFIVVKRSRGRSKTGTRAGCRTKDGYSVIAINGITYWEHHLVWLWATGSFPPKGTNLDHKNRIKDDNRPANLRLATPSQNNMNTGLRSDNKSGFRGVHFVKNLNKFKAQFFQNGKCKSLGYFTTAKEAATVAANARNEVFGEFANNPNM